MVPHDIEELRYDRLGNKPVFYAIRPARSS